MQINNWWVGDNHERYWMEITNRDKVGESLIAPQLNDRGLPEWSYEMVRHVRPGDVVFHWRKDHGPAITGYSHCTTSAYASSIEWQSRGTSGRQRPPQGEEKGWEALLQGYKELQVPVSLAVLRDREQDIRVARDELLQRQKRSSYFPFALSNKRPLRATQAYLVKFPASLVDLIPELQEAQQMAVDLPEEESPPADSHSKPSGGSSAYGRQNDPVRKRAVERYAVNQVIEHYEMLGFVTANVGATEPWDVTVSDGRLDLHIEVKGSTIERSAVDITEGEVRHAEDHSTILIVIDKISMDSQLRCSGGRWRYWSNWTPDREILIPTSYRHPLLTGGSDGRPQHM